MPHKITKSAFKDASMELYALNTHGECDVSRIERCADAIQSLIEKGDTARGGSQKMMRYVNAALRLIYPEIHPAERGKLNEYLQQELDILAKVIAGEKIAEHEHLQISRFCKDMWYQLGLAERDLAPHRGHT